MGGSDTAVLFHYELYHDRSFFSGLCRPFGGAGFSSYIVEKGFHPSRIFRHLLHACVDTVEAFSCHVDRIGDIRVLQEFVDVNIQVFHLLGTHHDGMIVVGLDGEPALRVGKGVPSCSLDDDFCIPDRHSVIFYDSRHRKRLSALLVSDQVVLAVNP